MNDKALLEYLLKKHMAAAGDLSRYQKIVDGDAPLGFTSPEVIRQYGDRVPPVNVNFPGLLVDLLNQMAGAPVGFRSSVGDVVDNAVTSRYRGLEIDQQGLMAQRDAMVGGIAYLWLGEVDGELVVTGESPSQVTVAWDPVTRKPAAALKIVRTLDGLTRAYVVTNETVSTYVSGASNAPDPAVIYDPVSMGDGWILESVVPNTLRMVPTEALVNRPSLMRPDGRSEIASLVPLVTAAAKLLSDMMVGSEWSADPRRIILTPAQVTKEQATEIANVSHQSMSAPGGTRMSVLGGGSDVKELSTASLDNYDRAVRLLVSLTAAIGSLPSHYVSSDVAAPTSADSIRAATSRLTSKAIERQKWWGPAYARMMRKVSLATGGAPDPQLDDLITLWNDPSPVSQAQASDSAVKLLQGGVTDRRGALESLNLDPVEVERVLATNPVTVV